MLLIPVSTERENGKTYLMLNWKSRGGRVGVGLKMVAPCSSFPLLLLSPLVFLSPFLTLLSLKENDSFEINSHQLLGEKKGGYSLVQKGCFGSGYLWKKLRFLRWLRGCNVLEQLLLQIFGRKVSVGAEEGCNEDWKWLLQVVLLFLSSLLLPYSLSLLSICSEFVYWNVLCLCRNEVFLWLRDDEIELHHYLEGKGRGWIGGVSLIREGCSLQRWCNGEGKNGDWGDRRLCRQSVLFHFPCNCDYCS